MWRQAPRRMDGWMGRKGAGRDSSFYSNLTRCSITEAELLPMDAKLHQPSIYALTRPLGGLSQRHRTSAGAGIISLYVQKFYRPCCCATLKKKKRCAGMLAKTDPSIEIDRLCISTEIDTLVAQVCSACFVECRAICNGDHPGTAISERYARYLVL